MSETVGTPRTDAVKHSPVLVLGLAMHMERELAELESFREDAERYRLIRAQICVSCPTHTKLDT